MPIIYTDTIDPDTLKLHYKKNETLTATAKVLGPLHLLLAQEIILLPFGYLILATGAFLSILWPLDHYGVFPFFRALGKSPDLVLVYVLTAAYCWAVEAFGGLSCCRWLLAKRLKVQLSETHLTVGRFPFRQRYARENYLAFMAEPLGGISPLYQRSVRILLQVQDRSISLAECADQREASALVSALNTTLALSSKMPGQDTHLPLRREEFHTSGESLPILQALDNFKAGTANKLRRLADIIQP